MCSDPKTIFKDVDQRKNSASGPSFLADCGLLGIVASVTRTESASNSPGGILGCGVSEPWDVLKLPSGYVKIAIEHDHL